MVDTFVFHYTNEGSINKFLPCLLKREGERMFPLLILLNLSILKSIAGLIVNLPPV